MSKEKSLYEIIRNGTEEEAREAYDKLLANSTKQASVAIMIRNLSHPLGKWVRKLKEGRKK
ncbi:hypothetical protein C4572_01775 [Candidatus Parcubacteria bacterium]|nr:MAG: hypothetical protein C4572_01775 [Candidatus Parcubacteria bacterium]